MPSPRVRAEFAYEGRYGGPPKGFVAARGRLLLLGEHVEAGGGPVLALPLRLGVTCAWGPRPDRSVRIVALDAKAGDRFVHGAYAKSGRRWADLVRGVCAALEAEGVRLPGIDLVVAGDLPARRGLGSSGAFLTAIVRAFDAARGDDPTPPSIVADVVTEAERTWGGADAAPLDAYVAAVGEPGRPLLVDTVRRTHETLPWPDGVEAVPIDTGVHPTRAETPWADRHAELLEGLKRLAHAREAARSAGTTPDDARLLDRLPEPFVRRARHHVTEVRRVLEGAQALRRGDAVALGRLVDESHRSLARDLQSSTPAVETMVAARRAEPGVLGVRMHGLGWGGCLLVVREARPPSSDAASSDNDTSGDATSGDDGPDAAAS